MKIPAKITSATPSGTSLTVVGTAGGGATIKVSVDGVVSATVVADASGNWTANLTGLAEGARNVSAQAFYSALSPTLNTEVCMARIKITAASPQTNVRPLITGNFFLYNGGLVSGRAVNFSYRAQGATDWIVDETAYTDASGNLSFQLSATLTDGTYEFRADMGSEAAGSPRIISNTVTILINKPDEAPVFGNPASLQYTGFYENLLFVGKTATNGTVVGRITPTNSAKPSPAYSISGAAASWLSINSATGIISVSDAASIPAAGTYAVSVSATNSAGTSSVTTVVNVVAAADLNYQFIDGQNGSDGNDGTQPHLPRLSVNPSATGWDFAFFKRGSTNNIIHRVRQSSISGSYGDTALPLAKIVAPSGEAYAMRPNLVGGSDNTNLTSCIVQDLDISGGDTRVVYVNGATDLIIRRNEIHDNRQDTANSNGMYLRGTINLKLHHNYIHDTFGDCIYLVKTNYKSSAPAGAIDTVLCEVSYNKIFSPSGKAGDCLQVTDENGNATQPNFNIWIHHNELIVASASTSQKGAAPLESRFGARMLVEANTIKGKYFALGTILPHSISRDNACYKSDYSGNSFNIGNGADFDVGYMQIYDNSSYGGVRGFAVSGFSDTDPVNGWQRPDTEFTFNTVYNNDEFAFIDRATSGVVVNNVSYGNGNPDVRLKNFALTAPAATGVLYTTLTTAPNYVQSGPGPSVSAPGAITGTCQDGQTMSVSAPTGVGISSVVNHWRVNGREVATGPSYTIPASTSAQTQSYMPATRQYAELSCVQEVKDAGGKVTLSVATFSDGSKYKRILA